MSEANPGWNRNNDTHPGRGCRSSPRPCQGVLYRRHGFQGFAKKRSPLAKILSLRSGRLRLKWWPDWAV